MTAVLLVLLSLTLVWAITATVLYATKFQETPNPPWTENEIRLLEKFPQGFVTFPRLGRFGRKGNQLFQMAAAISAGVTQNKPVRFHEWAYAPYYQHQSYLYDFAPGTDLVRPNVLEVAEFHHAAQDMTKTIVALDGYWQHPAHFHSIAGEIQEAFRLKPWIFDHVSQEYPILTEAIGVHVRRGDYVKNATHQVCTPEYFQFAVDLFRAQSSQNTPVVLFSDDPAWCLREMSFLTNCIVPTWHSADSGVPNEILDFAALQLCPHKIISNSTFGWWASWLTRETSQCLAPYPWIRGERFETSHHFTSMYLPEWYVYDCDAHCLLQRPTKRLHILDSIGAYLSHKMEPVFRTWYPKASIAVITETNNAMTFAKNFIRAARVIQEEWFIWMTDDVYIHRRPSIHFDSQYDVVAIKANNHSITDVWKPSSRQFIETVQTVPFLQSGSLFRTKFWATLNENIVAKQLENCSENPLGLLCSLNYGRILEVDQELYYGRQLPLNVNPSIQKGVVIPRNISPTLRIAFIGPGILKNRGGWGAIENLVDDYINWLNRLEMIAIKVDSNDYGVVKHLLTDFVPDVIHVQYDDYVTWIPRLQNDFPMSRLFFTLHHSYLLNFARWDTYKSVIDHLETLDKSRVVAVALSQPIRAFLKLKGFRWIFTQPNCADHEKIQFRHQAEFPNKSICLAKICPRKGQSRLADDLSIRFAGPIADDTFACHDRWLGEWSREEMQTNLTNYANLVLLSDGEADPLVVKEAMMAGLGLVLTKCAAANLPLNVPWIHIVEDRDDVSQIIAQNRSVALLHRDAIRAYAVKHFSYEVRVRSYVDFVSNWIKK